MIIEFVYCIECHIDHHHPHQNCERERVRIWLNWISISKESKENEQYLFIFVWPCEIKQLISKANYTLLYPHYSVVYRATTSVERPSVNFHYWFTQLDTHTHTYVSKSIELCVNMGLIFIVRVFAPFWFIHILTGHISGGRTDTLAHNVSSNWYFLSVLCVYQSNRWRMQTHYKKNQKSICLSLFDRIHAHKTGNKNNNTHVLPCRWMYSFVCNFSFT